MTLRDGKTLVWREQGAGTPVLMIHGWSLDGSLFSRQMEVLSGRFRVICPDLRGHGLSDASSDADIEVLAADIEELIGHLGLGGVVAVGWSLGAMVLWQMLSQGRHAAIAGLVIVDMSPMIHNTADWSLGMNDGRDYDSAVDAARATTASWPKMVRQFVPRIFSQGFAADNPAIVADTVAIAEQGDVPSLNAIWRAMVDADYRGALATIQVPALVAWGAQSRLYDAATARFVAGALPVSDMHEFTRSGHAPHVEEPDSFNTMIEVFARGVSGLNDNKTSIAIK